MQIGALKYLISHKQFALYQDFCHTAVTLLLTSNMKFASQSVLQFYGVTTHDGRTVFPSLDLRT